jgi:hypothetical protein
MNMESLIVYIGDGNVLNILKYIRVAEIFRGRLGTGVLLPKVWKFFNFGEIGTIFNESQFINHPKF